MNTQSQIQLCLFLVILLMFMWISMNYSPILEGFFDQFKLLLIVSPLILLLAVHCLSDSRYDRYSNFPISFPEKESLHRAGGTPWGVAFVLVFLFFMISYQSCFHDRWFPLLNRG